MTSVSVPACAPDSGVFLVPRAPVCSTETARSPAFPADQGAGASGCREAGVGLVGGRASIHSRGLSSSPHPGGSEKPPIKSIPLPTWILSSEFKPRYLGGFSVRPHDLQPDWRTGRGPQPQAGVAGWGTLWGGGRLCPGQKACPQGRGDLGLREPGPCHVSSSLEERLGHTHCTGSRQGAVPLAAGLAAPRCGSVPGLGLPRCQPWLLWVPFWDHKWAV